MIVSSAWRGWRFHPGAGTQKHGPTLDKPQTKVFFAEGSWWAVLARGESTHDPELAIFELVDGTQRWRDSGLVVSSDPLATADAHFDGSRLWVATRSARTGIRLQQLVLEAGSRSWRPHPRGSWQLPGIETPSVSVTTGSDGTVWVAYTTGHLPMCASAPIEAFPELGAPAPVPGARATLWDVDLAALVSLDAHVAVMWSDQGSESFQFALCSGDGAWTVETPLSGGLAADDHVAVRVLAGRVYAAVKTSRDDDPARAADGALLLLLVREPDGRWHHHQVAAVEDPVTRPMPMLDPESGTVHVFYTWGSNPGTRSIRKKTARLDTLRFPPGSGDVVLAGEGAHLNDVTGSRDPLTRRSGAVVLASDGAARHYYFARIALPGSTPARPREPARP